MMLIHEMLRHRLDGRIHLQHALDHARQFHELLDQLAFTVPVHPLMPRQ